MKAIVHKRRAMKVAGVAGAFLLATMLSLAAQKSPAAREAGGQTKSASGPSQTEIDAERGALDRFLDSHPEMGSEARSNPRNLADSNYVHDHPALEAFLDAHPLVKADPRAFLSSNVGMNFGNERAELDEVFSWFIPFLVFVILLIATLWVIRTVLENRRWNKSFRVHEEVHTKLLEKFASGQDLTAYLQSDAGRRLIEWAPATLEGPSFGMPAAAGRIMWSLQTGVVLALLGAGLFAARTQISTAAPGSMSSGAEVLAVCGVIGMALGAGFVLSALISYGLSKHLGLIGAGKANGGTAGALTASR